MEIAGSVSSQQLSSSNTSKRGELQSSSSVEQSLAELAIALLRDGGMTDAEIIERFTKVRAKQDRQYERDYFAAHGVRINARNVKNHMRRLLTA